MAAFPQQIKAYLSRSSDFKSLADVPEVADALKAGNGPVSLTYADPRRIHGLPLSASLHRLQMASRELRGKGSTSTWR